MARASTRASVGAGSALALAATAAMAIALAIAPPASAASAPLGAGHERVTLLVGLRQPEAGLAELDRLFWAVADPKNEEYGKHRTIEQIADIVGAAPESVEAGREWLVSLGATNVRVLASKDAMTAEWVVPKPADDAEHIMAPRVPQHLKDDHVDFCILVRDKFPAHLARTPTRASRPRGTAGDAASVADPSMDLAAQKAAYGVPASLVGDHPKNLQMVWGTATFGLIKSDLQLFYENYCPSCNISQVSLDKDSVWKPGDPTGDNTFESMLDTEYISGMTGNVRTLVSNTNTTASTSGSVGFGVALVHFLTADLGTRTKDVPLVLSMSLGSLSYASCDRMCTGLAGGVYSYDQCWHYLSVEQSQVCMYADDSEVTRSSTEMQKLGLRGMTIAGSSGDGGSHFSFGPFEQSGIGGALNDLVCQSMNAPVFPTTSPYILSVGGSQWAASGSGPGCSPDKPCGWDSGGGGFSWDFDMPPYQQGVTASYLTATNKARDMCAASTYAGGGRGYPDVVSLAAVGIPLCIQGGCMGSGGTSASSPTVAGMISLINDARLSKGLPSLGFINTRLYQLASDPATRAEMFYDIAFDTQESGWDCNQFSTCDGCNTGFPALTGWDAQTGWGQPHFEGWLKHLGTDS